MVSPVTKPASAEARKQITRAWSAASATHGAAASARLLLGLRGLRALVPCGRMRSVSVMLGAMALTLMLSGPSS